jgi:glycerophosphoryl diester phosphodiesterase
MTSYEPALLLAIQEICPGLTVDLLFPRSEEWMQLDVVQYQAMQYARLARTRAVHLHPTQLSETVVAALRKQGIKIHAWDVNDEQALELIAQLHVPKIGTDRFKMAYTYRGKLS